MYPPPMPIYCQAPDEGPLYIIETEKINRSRRDDVDTFNPRRWTEDGAENKPFLSFGVGRYSCPTQRDWGFRVIGLVIAAVIQETEARGYIHLAGEESKEVIEIDSFSKHKPLQSERAAYPLLELRKRKL